MENKQEKSQEDMVKEAVEEAKKSAAEAKEAETDTDETTETSEKVENEEAEETAKDTEKKSGKKLFGKKKDKKDEKIEELTDKLTRQMAEFDNFRKRTEKEKSQMYEVGAKDIIEKILPVVDNFERGLDAVKEEDKEDPFVQGMEKVYKQPGILSGTSFARRSDSERGSFCTRATSLIASLVAIVPYVMICATFS